MVNVTKAPIGIQRMRPKLIRIPLKLRYSRDSRWPSKIPRFQFSCVLFAVVKSEFRQILFLQAPLDLDACNVCVSYLTMARLTDTSNIYFLRPSWIFASIYTFIGAWPADKTGELFVHQKVWWRVVIIGYSIIFLSATATPGRYFSLTTGYCGFTLTLVWVANVIPRPPAKRSVTMGWSTGLVIWET